MGNDEVKWFIKLYRELPSQKVYFVVQGTTKSNGSQILTGYYKVKWFTKSCMELPCQIVYKVEYEMVNCQYPGSRGKGGL